MGAITVGRPDLAVARASMRDADITYPAAYRGATLGGKPLPSGYAHDRVAVPVGRGRDDFVRAVVALQTWRAHEAADIVVHPADPPEVGGTLVQRIDVGPLRVLGCLRIVSAIDDSRRFGFAFGSLPLHVEEGEEALIVSLDDDETVWFGVLAFSRPRHPLVRLGLPVTRALQHRAHAAYLRGVQRAVAARA